MAYLFHIEGKKVQPTAEVLLLFPFSEIWERDPSPGKELAMREFAYIEFMSSARKTNPFKGYPEDKKSAAILKQVFIDDQDWRPDDLVIDGIHHWETFQKEASTTYRFWVSAKRGAEKLADYFNEADLTEKNEKGALVYKSTDMANNLQKTKAILSNLKGLEKDVEQELFEESRTKSDKRVSPFARRESFR